MGGPLNFSEITAVKTKYPSFKKSNAFVETGTGHGRTALAMSPHFKHVHTIEVMKALHDEVKAKAAKAGLANVTNYLGDSTKILPPLLRKIREPVVFFLDGHFCGRGSGRGQKDMPLIDELVAIRDNHRYKDIIIIDDVSFFQRVKRGLDWRNITIGNIKTIMGESAVRCWTAHDRLIILKN